MSNSVKVFRGIANLFVIQVFKLNLPVIETDFNAKLPDPQLQETNRVPTKRSGDEESGWRCPVCFHQQTRATSTCEICAAQNPASVEFQSLLQCSACRFRNKPDARTCELCAVTLRRSVPLSNTRTPCSPTKQCSIASQTAVPCDGWLE